MKYLGLDLGSKTLGVAVSDVTGFIASSYGTIRHEEDYDSLIEEVKKLVDAYISEGAEVLCIANSRMLNAARNKIANNLLDEFIYKIKMDRAKTDFAKELENI